MVTCEHDGCSWTAIAPSAGAARDRYARHLVEDHGQRVDADVPAGTVEIRTGEDDTWQRVSLEEAKRRHRQQHDGA